MWQECIALQPENSKSHFNLGYAFLKLERYEEALLASARAMELAPDFKEAIFNYSLCEFCTGDLQKVIAALEDLLVKEPRYPSAIALLSAAYLIEGEREKGLEILGRMKGMGHDGAASLHSFAERLIAAGRLDAAVLLLKEAIETQNVNGQTQGLLAQCQGVGKGENRPSLRP